jgi:hypothetical protein
VRIHAAPRQHTPPPARSGSPAFRASRLCSPARSRATACPPASRFPAKLPLAARLRAPLALAPRALLLHAASSCIRALCQLLHLPRALLCRAIHTPARTAPEPLPPLHLPLLRSAARRSAQAASARSSTAGLRAKPPRALCRPLWPLRRPHAHLRRPLSACSAPDPPRCLGPLQPRAALPPVRLGRAAAHPRAPRLAWAARRPGSRRSRRC